MSTLKRSKTRTTFHHGDLNAALREAALAFIRRHGVEGFSLREVAREVGVSPSATYRHFADRAALLSAVAADGFTKLGLAMERATADATGQPEGALERARLRAVVGAYVRFATTHPEELQVMFGPYGIGGATAAVLRLRDPDRPKAIDQLRMRIDGLITAGEVPEADRERAVVFVWATAHGLAWLLMDRALDAVRADAETDDDIVEGTTRQILRGLGAR